MLLFAAGAMSTVRGAAPNETSVDRSVAAVAAQGPEWQLATVGTAQSIRANLASVAASAFEPAREGVVELATFGSKPVAAVLNVPPPGAMAPAAPAVDHIPEPGAIGFGLAVAALIFGNFAKSLMKCWKITGAPADRREL